ncbi:MAG: hypothetical protein HKP44_06035 [Desulfofustis sp.]|nr:hypothetical protein [Desulfofustis sp.]NNK56853.1 hypothetical protein [Desulfofustis sp.]
MSIRNIENSAQFIGTIILSALYLRPYVAFLFILPLLAVSCNSPTTPEEIATQFIRESEEAFEERDILGLKKLISPQYRDSQNRTAGDVVSIAAAYIRSSKSIYLFTDLDSAVNAEEHIQAKVLGAFTARPISDRSILGRIQADIYWFDITLAQENDGWKLVEAQWKQAVVDDFFRNGNPNGVSDD